MSERNRLISIEILVGFFMFLVLIALGVFTIVLSKQNLFHVSYPIAVHFSEVGGLRAGDTVLLRGTKVGVVKSTDLTHDGVTVRADLNIAVELREGYRIDIGDSSLLGGKVLKIYEGPLNAAPVPADAVIIGTAPVDLFDDLGIAVRDIREMISNTSAGNGTLGKLISDDAIYNDLHSLTANLRELSDRLVQGKGTLGRLFSDDDRIYTDLQSTMANISSITDKLNTGEGTLGKLIQDETVYTDIQQMMSNFNKVSEGLANGEGTLGKLITDDEIYTEAKLLLSELRAAIDDMRETSPVTTFSSVLFGAF